MKTFVIEVPVHCTRVYIVDAANQQSAEAMVRLGDIPSWSTKNAKLASESEWLVREVNE